MAEVLAGETGVLESCPTLNLQLGRFSNTSLCPLNTKVCVTRSASQFGKSSELL